MHVHALLDAQLLIQLLYASRQKEEKGRRDRKIRQPRQQAERLTDWTHEIPSPFLVSTIRLTEKSILLPPAAQRRRNSPNQQKASQYRVKENERACQIDTMTFCAPPCLCPPAGLFTGLQPKAKKASVIFLASRSTPEERMTQN
mmetsp:Transcript_46131/g.90923  ORF Transcript_46131/g.90923 Transcript_46131/m.90923 type:complete len:144 (+) Transcript_46131:330-761(+)